RLRGPRGRAHPGQCRRGRHLAEPRGPGRDEHEPEGGGSGLPRRAGGRGVSFIDIVFDGPPEHNAPRFVEVEDEHGAGIRAGDWLQRDDGYWVLRIPTTD